MGQRQALRTPTRLEGDCGGATHYVKTLTVGAYEVLATAERQAHGEGRVLHADASASSRGHTKHLRGVGDLEACANKPEISGCQGILQLGQVELPKDLIRPNSAATSQSIQTAGFGQGLGRKMASAESDRILQAAKI